MSPRNEELPSKNPKNRETRIRMSNTDVRKLEYCSQKTGLTKSDVIRLGIETLFKDISEKANQEYKDNMKKILNNKLIPLFDNICNLLEALASSCGNILEDELKFFIIYTQRLEQNENKIEFTQEEASRMDVFKYDKVESILVKNGYTEKDFSKIALILKNYYKK